MATRRPWTPEDESIVRAGVAAGVPWAELAASLGRTVPAVQVRASRLGLRAVDMAGATSSSDRWGIGKPAGGIYWTRGRIDAALRSFVARSSGLLPAGSYEFDDARRGDPRLPTADAVCRRLLTPDCPTFGHVWLRLGAPRARVKTLGGAWTAAEHEYLMSRAGGQQRLVDIARYLHRSYGACRRRLYEHGERARDLQGFMSAQQVADEYGCDVKRVVRLIRKGILPARLVHGNRYQVDPGDAMRLRAVLSAPPARGKGWTYGADGLVVPPVRSRRRPEPEVITRVNRVPPGRAA